MIVVHSSAEAVQQRNLHINLSHFSHSLLTGLPLFFHSQLSKIVLNVSVYTIYLTLNDFDVIRCFTDDCETFVCEVLACTRDG